MTLELNQVAAQVKSMGQNLAEQQSRRDDALAVARALLTEHSRRFTPLAERIQQAEKVLQKLRFDWVGAAPTGEALDATYPLPECPPQLTVIASDGSQIYPDPHGITLYYLINTGCIVYRHGSGQKPHTWNPPPMLRYQPDDVLDDQGRLISAGEVSVQRDMAEMEALARLAPAYTTGDEPVVALTDGQLPLRVIDLPFSEQGERQNEYIDLLNDLRECNALLGGYIDRPRSTFVLSLLHLASLPEGGVTEDNLRHNPFRHLTDIDLFSFLGPGQRSALFITKAKGLEKYTQAGHTIHFFYLNVSAKESQLMLARIEIPAWVATNPQALDTLHAAIVRQARITGSYPYVLARADELAVVSGEEREAVEMMLAVELRRNGLQPQVSLKQRNKNAYRATKEGFQL
jgi:hypothetical protein